MSRSTLYRLVLSLCLAGWGWIDWNGVADGWSGGDAVPTPCLVRQATGLPCPSCGTTRAIEAVVVGDIGRAARTNPFGILLALSMAAFPLWVVHDLARSRDGFHRFYLGVERTFRRPAFAVAGAALALANWGWNILKGL